VVVRIISEARKIINIKCMHASVSFSYIH
jgi:hypothetical protein